ncbi:serine protease snake-like [Episyrphus balteatus]|uniref:serine protease snake-like n=1 Tax=Episyrphus balteatus TaxID=286459 RepID=UPI0024864B1D|nr:serine protease snake-like [Episyrphus balteatus]
MSCKSLLFVIIRFQVLLLTLFCGDCQTLNTTSIFNISHSSLYPISLNNDYQSQVFYITGGKPSYYREFPFMAALGWFNDTGGLNYHGGGMVISPRMILTAAHCVYKNGKLPDSVFIGGDPLSKVTATNFFSIYGVVNVTVFPEYTSSLAYDDIAILELNERTWYPPVCLWNCEDLNTADATAIGYGLTEFAGMGSEELLKVNLTIFSPEYCEPFFKRQRKFKLGLSDAHICAGDKDGVKDTCQGDSGGPLIIQQNGQNFAIGITSSGQACSGFPPAIYTRIQPYIEWITSVLEERGESLVDCPCPIKDQNIRHDRNKND